MVWPVRSRNAAKVSGNSGAGIYLNSGPHEVRVQNNYIGTNIAGTGAIANNFGIDNQAVNSDISDSRS